MSEKPRMKARTTYINCKFDDGSIETIDQFPANTREERLYITEMLHEYRMAFSNYRGIYKSQRPTEDYDE